VPNTAMTETSTVNQSIDPTSSPRHDILEVNNYLISGLSTSCIDRWFAGPTPSFSPHDLGVPGDKDDVPTILEKARTVASDSTQIAWKSVRNLLLSVEFGLSYFRLNGPQKVPQKDLNHIDRNLNALVEELATRCRQVFDGAADAFSRSATISSGAWHLSSSPSLSPSKSSFCIRERSVLINEVSIWSNYTCSPSKTV
jgi:anaphase-promoting complex subunit 4